MPLLRRLMHISCRLTEAAGGSISIIDSPGQRYTKIAERGTACRLGQSFPVDEGVTGKVMASRRPVVLGSYRDVAAGHLAVGHPAGDGAVAAIPIWWRGDVIGVNVVFAGCPRPFSTTEVDQLEILTQLVAPGVVMAAERDLSLNYLAAQETSGAAESGRRTTLDGSIARREAVSPSVVEVALGLAVLGERAGVYSSRPGERLYVAVVREGEGLHLLVPGHSNDLREVGGSIQLGGWRELVDSVESGVEFQPPDGEVEGIPSHPVLLPASGRGPEPSPFSPRERQVAALLARGLSDRSVAKELLISQKTVEKHVGAVLRKTGTPSRTAAVMRALEEGWLVGSSPAP